MEILPTRIRSTFGNLTASSVIPINDLKGTRSGSFTEGESLLRCKLAALYRLVDLCGWTYGIYNHISARVNSQDEHFLLNPFGMRYSEITASSLVKIDLQGDIIEQGSTQFGINKAGYTLHSAIHEGRPDIKCIIHLHTPTIVAVSAMKCGLLPISQWSILCGNISYHDYHGIFIDPEEKKTLVKDLGPHNKIMILHNHGVVCCGETLEEAFHHTVNLMAACRTQIRAVPLGLNSIALPNDEVKAQVNQMANEGGTVMDFQSNWKTGQLEFEALMRALDNLGHRTGYDYKLLPMKKNMPKEA